MDDLTYSVANFDTLIDNFDHRSAVDCDCYMDMLDVYHNTVN